MAITPHTTLGGGSEFDRIRAIMTALGPAAGVLGDDTGVIPSGVGTLVTSTDASVEEVHFRTHWLTMAEIGWRATAAALSDLAPAGAIPAGAVVAVGVPPGATPTAVVELMEGVGACVMAAGTRILGGDLTQSPCWSVTVTVFGYAATLVSRRGARVGDALWVTGTLGGARAAWQSWEDGGTPAPATRAAFAHPRARIQTGAWLAHAGATAMIDLSDGLAGDAEHLAAASEVCCELRLSALPTHPAIGPVAARCGVTAPHFAAQGGEDYELLVALPATWDDAAWCEAATGVPITRIGRVAAGNGVVWVDGTGSAAPRSFRHPL